MRIGACWPVVLATILAVAAGCAADDPTTDVQLGVTDSAGIRIVVSRADPSALERWQVGPTPDLVLGRATGSAAELFSDVKAAVRLPEGSIAIADNSQIRLFSDDGTFLRTIGGRGAGPGEFRALRSLRVLGGDTLVAYDAYGHRVSYFSPEGNLLRDIQLPLKGYGIGVSVLGPFADGAFFARVRETTSTDEIEEGPVRDSTLLLHIPSPALKSDTVGWTPAVDLYRVFTDEGGPRATFDAIPPYWRRIYFATGPDRLFIGHNDRFDIRAIDSNGSDSLRMRLVSEDRAVDHGELDRVKEAYLTSARFGWEELQERAARDAEYPDTWPAHADLFADREGNLWAANYTPPGHDSAPVAWRVFGPDGAPKAVVETPAGAELLDAGRDYLLTLELDALDVPRVMRYPLTRDPS